MPPPHIQSNTGTSSQQHAHHQAGGAAPAALSDLPKHIRTLTRDVLQNIQTALTIEDEATIQQASLKAFEAIEKLVNSPDIESEKETESVKATSSHRGRPIATSEPVAATTLISTQGDHSVIPLGKQVSSIVNTSLFYCFSDEMDQGSSNRCQLLITFLHALRSILPPRSIVLQWWDVLLRPMLKDPNCDVRVSTKAQLLITWVMESTPSSAYDDEAFPSAAWPRPDQSSVVAAAAQRARRPGDAPYPASSTRSASNTRSSEDADARSLALYSTTTKRNASQDSLRLFTQSIFDLYVSERASASSKTVEDHEMQGDNGDDSSDDDQSGKQIPSGSRKQPAQDSIASTWMGNLEAIILTFGEERPKAFFHHLSECFMDPLARIPVLLLLTIFLRLSSLHVYHVVSTPFVRLLILSLQLDTSKVCTSLSVLALVSLIPHFPNWLASGGAGGLPALLSIFARILDWRKVLPGWEERCNDITHSSEEDGGEAKESEKVKHLSKRLQLRAGLEWSRLESNYDSAKTRRPDALKLFTILYGIFPCNVIRFLRAPIDYLRKAEYQSPFQSEWEDIIDEDIVQSKSASVLHRHRLHPALVDMTAEREISDTQRWSEHDPSSTAAYCASLCLQDGEPSPFSEPLLAGGAFSTSNRSSSTLYDRILMNNPSFSGNGSPGQRNSAAPLLSLRRRSLSETAGQDLDSSAVPNSQISSHLLLQSMRRRSPSLPLDAGRITPLSLETSRHPSSRSSATEAAQRSSSNLHLQTHVALRSGWPSPTARSSSGSNYGRSTSLRSSTSNTNASHVRSFQPAQSNLASSLVSPSRSSGLAYATSTPSSPGLDGVSTSPLESAEKALLGSPALSLGNGSPAAQQAVMLARKGKISYLKQENMQLRNELNYELGQKDQLLRHIGTIHRNRVRDTVREEELQNLYQSRRSDAIQKRSMRDELESIKAEQRQGKVRHANWQADLTAKSKAMREEKRVWASEVRLLKKEKEDREELIEKLERQLDENASELFDLRKRTRDNAEKIDAIQRYEDRISQLETAMRYWNEDMHTFEQQNAEMRTLLRRWEEMRMLVDVSERQANGAQASHEALQQDKEILERKLAQANEAILVMSQKRETGSKAATRRGGEGGCPSPTSVTSKREEASKAQAKKRVEELESQLLDAKAREEELLMSMKKWQARRQAQTGGDVMQDRSSDRLALDHEIAPLTLEDDRHA